MIFRNPRITLFAISLLLACQVSANTPVLRVTCDESYPPFQYVDQSGKPVGFDVDLVKSLGVVMGWDIEINTAPWYKMVSDLENNQADLIPGMYVKADRLTTYELSTPILVSFHSFFVRNNGRVRSYNDIITSSDKLSIILYNSQVLREYLEQLSPNIQMIYVENNLKGLQLLASGKGDAMLLPKHVGMFLVENNKLTNLKSVGLPVLPRDYVMAVKKGNTDLINEVNKGLAILQETGQYDEIYNKWFGSLERDQSLSKWLRITLVVVGVVLVLLIASVVYSRLLRRQVKRNTMELNLKIQELADAQEQLQEEKERAVRTDRLKSAFLANMSHEIRTPMNAIIGFSELLADPDITRSEREYYQSLVNVNSEVLLNLINDIIDISKIEARQLTLRIEPTDPSVLLSDMLPVFQHELKNKRKEHLILSYLPPEWNNEQLVLSDPHRLRQIITNLVVNAIKFTNEGFVSFGFLRAEGDAVKFFVRDSGYGIPPDKLETVFDRFHQLGQGKHDKQSGAGLGLSITSGLIELMGGKIWVESELGKGSTFWFSLPLYKKDLNTLN